MFAPSRLVQGATLSPVRSSKRVPARARAALSPPHSGFSSTALTDRQVSWNASTCHTNARQPLLDQQEVPARLHAAMPWPGSTPQILLGGTGSLRVDFARSRAEGAPRDESLESARSRVHRRPPPRARSPRMSEVSFGRSLDSSCACLRCGIADVIRHLLREPAHQPDRVIERPS